MAGLPLHGLHSRFGLMSHLPVLWSHGDVRVAWYYF